MAKQLIKQTIGVGVAGTEFIGPAHIERLAPKKYFVKGIVIGAVMG